MNVYFSGIGGVGIGPLAEIAHDAGYSVSGSDREPGLMTRELEKRGVTISYDQSGSSLRSQHESTPVDWFVYTSALPANHPELVMARQLGIRISKRDEFLAELISEKSLKLIAVAGTHGKTTTTGMIVWALQQLGVPISYSVGTTLSWGSSGKFDPASEYFVYECDEFDRNFLHFSPHLSLITSIEHDHPDTYPTEADYLAAFGKFIMQSKQTIMWAHDKNGIPTPDSAWLLQDSDVQESTLAGAHNRQNATLVIKAAEFLQLDNPTRQLESFPGTNRRMEKLTNNLYSDYGHTPTEIAATLQLARELSDHIVLVYQPHQNVRQHEIRQQYIDQFELAEQVYWLPTYLSRENPELAILMPEELTKNLTNHESVHITALDESLWAAIERHRAAGHLVLCMGAGSIDSWVRTQLAS